VSREKRFQCERPREKRGTVGPATGNVVLDYIAGMCKWLSSGWWWFLPTLHRRTFVLRLDVPRIYGSCVVGTQLVFHWC